MKNTVFIYTLLLIFTISNTALYGGWFDEEQKSQELEEIKKKQDLFEQKLNQIVKKLDQIQVAVGKISTQKPQVDNKKPPKRKPADPNYVHKIDAGDSYFIGNPNAKVTITEFFDYQ